MQDFRNLRAWKKGHELTLEMYRVTANFPRDERYGITSQLRRACSSIPANLAEGCGRGSDADFRRFVYVAMGSASETEYFLLLSRQLNFVNELDYKNMGSAITEVKQMLARLIQTLGGD